MVRQLAVLGSPIEHSKSPAIHQAAYRVLGLPWEYRKFEVRAGGLSNFVDSLDEQWLGLSLTMPLKEEAARLAIDLDDSANLTGAANTLLKVPEGWRGFNTDVFGMIQALRQAGVTAPKSVLIIGSGATATSAMLAVRQINENAKVSVFARNESTRKELLAFGSRLGLSTRSIDRLRAACAKSELVISTLPANALDEYALKFRKLRFFQPRGILFDVIYKDWPTELAKTWIAKQRQSISGLDMLIWQAVAQIRIFAHQDPGQALPNEVAVIEAMRHSVSD